MAYTRKTRDTFELHVNYGQGWEYEIEEDTLRAARQQQRDYRDNCPQYPTKVVRRRERIEA